MEMRIISRRHTWRKIYALGPWAARVPVYHCGVSCGRGSELFDVSRTYFDLASYCGTSRESTYLVEAQGDSMTPVIEDGDLMVVDKDRAPQNGDIILACVDNGDVLAKYYKMDRDAGTMTLTPANKAYPVRTYSNQEHKVACLGVVRHIIRNIGRRPKLNIMKMSLPFAATSPTLQNNNNNDSQHTLKTGVANTLHPLRIASPECLRANINQKELSQMFKAQFKGAGGHPDYFTNNLMADLGLIWSDRQIAIIAFMIYEGGWLAGKPGSFTEWYRQFCVLMGRNCNPHYRPCKLAPPDAMKRRFYYLRKE